MEPMSEEGIATGARMLAELCTNKDRLSEWQEDPLRVLKGLGFEVNLEASTAPDLRTYLATLPVSVPSADDGWSGCIWCQIGIGIVMAGVGAALVAAILLTLGLAIAAAIASGGTAAPEAVAADVIADAALEAAAVEATAALCSLPAAVFMATLSAALVIALETSFATAAELFLAVLLLQICIKNGSCDPVINQ